jgi:hypothetical protein
MGGAVTECLVFLLFTTFAVGKESAQVKAAASPVKGGGLDWSQTLRIMR